MLRFAILVQRTKTDCRGGKESFFLSFFSKIAVIPGSIGEISCLDPRQYHLQLKLHCVIKLGSNLCFL